MNKLLCLGIILILGLLMINPATANDKSADTGPWEKWSLNFGGFIASTETSFRLGSGAGVVIDVEELLDLDTTNYVYRLGGRWRFSKNRKHSLDLSWFFFFFGPSSSYALRVNCSYPTAYPQRIF